MENPNHLNESNEAIPEEDVDIELEDDAELIFPYEVEGDKTSPPEDVSSDLVSSESESEDEEVDVSPEDKIKEKERELLNHDLENVKRALGNVLERVSLLENMVCIGAVLKSPSDDEDTERLRKKSKNSTSDGTEGPSEPRGPPSDS
nr:hypothetical protein [Tanacetum cinerariifolium]